jgi:hypothetical protein
MVDISLNTDGDSVTFSANSPAADLWMRAEYDDQHIVTFHYPSEVEDAKTFRARAEENGFTVG